MNDLSAAKLAELRARRDALRAEAELAKQRGYIKWLLEPLDELGIDYQLGYQDHDASAWLQPFFNWKHESRQHMVSRESIEDVEHSDIVRWIAQLAAREQLLDQPVVFFSDNLVEPIVRLKLADLLRVPDALAWGLGGYHWIAQVQERWAFEIAGFNAWWGKYPEGLSK